MIRSSCVAVFALVAATAHADSGDTADATTAGAPERSLPYGAGASLAVLTTRTTNPVTTFPREVMGTGLTLRLQGSFGLVGAGAFSLAAHAAGETGLGYQNFDGEYTGHLWFLLRLEVGGQASVAVSNDVDVSVRAGIYAHINAAREVGGYARVDARRRITIPSDNLARGGVSFPV